MERLDRLYKDTEEIMEREIIVPDAHKDIMRTLSTKAAEEHDFRTALSDRITELFRQIRYNGDR